MARVVLSLFDYTGIMVEPWAAAGYECLCVDEQHEAEPRMEHGISFIKLDLSGTSGDWQLLRSELRFQRCIIFGFPPCTDLSIAGAKHFESKAAADPFFQQKAIEMAVYIADLAESLDAPYAIENPASMLSTLWRKWDYKFHPYEYGGYLPPDDKHPTYPDILPPRDAYEKTTCIWANSKFVMPPMRKVEPIYYIKNGGRFAPQFVKIGGKSLKTKNIRSATPRGFAQAVYWSNKWPE